MDDKELFEQLARGPLTRNGFDESLRRKINESLDQPVRKRNKNRPWFIRWNAASISMLLLIGVAVGVWGWHGIATDNADKQFQASQQPSETSHAASTEEINPIPHSAVVIGLRQDGAQGDNRSSYRTFIVAPENDQLSFVKSGEGIWMPYKSDFWKIDAVADDLGKGTQTLLSARGGRGDWNAAMFKDSIRATEKLLYAGNEFVSILRTVNVDENGNSVDKSSAWVNSVADLTSANRGTSSDSLEVNHYSLAKALKNNPTGADADEWAISRDSAKWVAKQSTSAGVVEVSAIPGWPTIPVELTDNIVKDKPLAISWDKVVKLEPTAVDAYTSQDQDVVVIVTPTSIKLYPYQLPKSEMKPVDIELGSNESVVMVQWATKQSYVENWKTMFTKWFAASAK
ncbi:hypothetical protein D7Z26_03215 [Cohnella endophytica]|uniref:Uncharacterized protein n=1 Tax=Cohnella endophytica TaxID=2419778 RepID=A0A494YAQ7_9BACL|nr:hypothetical protein [Cohnella endophytica]RKP57012.1 hypothetical protein D7Z26_03215 [Cohnella endophytica]